MNDAVKPNYTAQAAWNAIGAAEQRYNAKKADFEERLRVALAQTRLEGWTDIYFDDYLDDVLYLHKLCGGDIKLARAVMQATEGFVNDDVVNLGVYWPHAKDGKLALAGVSVDELRIAAGLPPYVVRGT